MAIYAVAHPTFQPAMRIVNAITNAFPAQVTTTFAHDYVTGEVIRLIIPPAYGMQQANQLYAQIEVIDETNFFIDIDTTYFDTFTFTEPDADNKLTPPQCVPIGEDNAILTAATQNVLPL